MNSGKIGWVDNGKQRVYVPKQHGLQVLDEKVSSLFFSLLPAGEGKDSGSQEDAICTPYRSRVQALNELEEECKQKEGYAKGLNDEVARLQKFAALFP